MNRLKLQDQCEVDTKKYIGMVFRTQNWDSGLGSREIKICELKLFHLFPFNKSEQTNSKGLLPMGEPTRACLTVAEFDHWNFYSDLSPC